MTREELISYIRQNDKLYAKEDLGNRSDAELRRLKELIEVLKENQKRLSNTKKN